MVYINVHSIYTPVYNYTKSVAIQHHHSKMQFERNNFLILIIVSKSRTEDILINLSPWVGWGSTV